MNWNKNNNDNNPWGSGGNNNPWGSGNNDSNGMDFEDSIKKARDKFGKFKFGGKRNFSLFIIIAILVWLATGFYRVEPDEQGVELLFGRPNATSIYFLYALYEFHKQQPQAILKMQPPRQSTQLHFLGFNLYQTKGLSGHMAT